VPLDLLEFGNKLRRCREQLQLSFPEVLAGTGIAEDRLRALERGEAVPSGDEVLIFADFFHCDYRFFVSNEKLAAFEQTDMLYRRYGEDFSKADRLRVQEFLFLCECEHFLLTGLDRPADIFRFTPSGKYFKGHAQQAASSLRRYFGYADTEVPSDVYSDFRRIGFHVFRRSLENSNISGLTIRHPFAGPCLLVNYSEDIYRQRFTAAHEAAHGILDVGEDVVVSFNARDRNNLVEVRANSFASRYLLPQEVVSSIPVARWSHLEIMQWASKLKVSTIALAIALKEAGIVDDAAAKHLAEARVPAREKVDPELENLTGRSVERKIELLQRGLTSFYVNLCFEALGSGIITARRAAEMMLVDDFELAELATLFSVRLLSD
jgi:Zn-dependent peptidase ImmA (M78 family)/transcriptional regulator with XRE-family HTH domain